MDAVPIVIVVRVSHARTVVDVRPRVVRRRLALEVLMMMRAAAELRRIAYKAPVPMFVAILAQDAVPVRIVAPALLAKPVSAHRIVAILRVDTSALKNGSITSREARNLSQAWRLSQRALVPA